MSSRHHTFQAQVRLNKLRRHLCGPSDSEGPRNQQFLDRNGNLRDSAQRTTERATFEFDAFLLPRSDAHYSYRYRPSSVLWIRFSDNQALTLHFLYQIRNQSFHHLSECGNPPISSINGYKVYQTDTWWTAELGHDHRSAYIHDPNGIQMLFEALVKRFRTPSAVAY